MPIEKPTEQPTDTSADTPAAPRLVLYRRAECSACDRATDALRSIASVVGVGWQEREVDGDNELEARYGARVPVIVLEGEGEVEPVELAATHVNAGALARDLRAALRRA